MTAADPFTPDTHSCLIWMVRERDGVAVMLRKFCGELSCPDCRARRVDHYRRCFARRTIRSLLVVDGKAWKAFTTRVRRAGGLYVGVPAADGDVTVFNTVFGEVVADPVAEVVEAMEARPDDQRHIRASALWVLDSKRVRDPDPADDPDGHDHDNDGDVPADGLPVDQDAADSTPLLTLCAGPPVGWRFLGWSGATPTRIVEVAKNLDLEPLVFPPFARGPAIKGISFTMPALADPKRMLLEGAIRLRAGRQWQQRGVA